MEYLEALGNNFIFPWKTYLLLKTGPEKSLSSNMAPYWSYQEYKFYY